MRAAQVLPRTGLEPEYPMSPAVYENHANAQRAVDYLSDKDFGVASLVIVGTDLTRGGTRDFSSVSQVVATKYEVMVEHRLAEQARARLAAMPIA